MQPISVVENVIPACQLSTIDRFILGPSVGNWEFIWPTTTLSNGANKKNMENYKKKIWESVAAKHWEFRGQTRGNQKIRLTVNHQNQDLSS